MEKSYDIVLSGAGSRIILHLGFVQCLHDYNIKVQRIAGTSSGALIASLLSLDKNIDEIKNTIFKLNFEDIVYDYSFWPLRLWNLFSNGGMSSSYKLRQFTKKLTEGKRFKDIEKDLYLIAYNINSKETKVFCKEKTPNVLISEAATASAALPLAFAPVEIDGELYIDGGISKNFPIDLAPLKNTIIGHLIGASKIKDKKSYTFKEMLNELASDVFFGNSSSSISDAIYDKEFEGKDIHIVNSDYDISFVDFKLSEKEKEEMYKIGYENTKKKLEEINGTLHL